MSTGRTLAIERAQILRGFILEAGAPEVSIEIQDGRPASGDTYNACRPVAGTSHHIASRPTVANPTPGLALVKGGRSDLGPPLANGTAGMDLVYRILCMGYANHPGFGGPLTVTGPCGTYVIPKDNGRAYLWGTEYEGGYDEAVWDATYTNKRTGKSMTYREFMGRCNAGIVRGIWAINGHGRTPAAGVDLSGYQTEHKTWAPGRKPDRLGYTTESGRDEVRQYANQEDEVSAADVWAHPIEVVGERGPIPARAMLSETHNRSALARAEAARAGRVADRNRAALKAMTKGLPGDVADAVVKALGDDEPATPDEAPA